MPVARDVLAHAAQRPDRVAVRAIGHARTYAELAADIDDAAGRMWATGVRPGQVVAVDFAEPADMLAAILAADLIGAVPLVCDPAWSAGHRDDVLETIRPDHHVHVASGETSAYQPWPARPDDLAWAGFSSGSTGRPRAVVRTRGSWTGSYPAAQKLAGMTPDDRILVPGPLVSSLFCFAALHGLALGAEVIVTGRWRPGVVREFLAGVDIVHAVPHMLDQMLTALESSGDGSRPAPHRIRTALVSGAALLPGLRERAAALGIALVAYYGAVELSFVAADTDGTGLRPFDGVEIDLRRADGDDTVGEVWVRSPWIASRYLGGASGPFRRDDAGWASVGDLAAVGADTLRLRGRGDGAVITGGSTVVPEDVESVLVAVPGVRGVVVTGTPHGRLGAVVTAVIETGDPPVSRRLLEEAARSHLSAAQRPRRWLVVENLPRTAVGKPARAAISEGLRTGTLRTRPLGPGAHEDTYE
ncbi:AMP-binding protein [Phytoactinopolyspora alkaliphila]|uniref:AMP-binding protein n=1 Tax=Phytoactinopolyspora alkaliphila TaxID=1783498 RepID=A0A6N9YMF0_9ACTN|nr:AMP-binding protein [Phytoactinopolyspora alkaliphila]NED96117.1 AMP-binding protein [Phytoactinopolyspora alkaliphila]